MTAEDDLEVLEAAYLLLNEKYTDALKTIDNLKKQNIKGAKLLEECHKKLTKKHQTKIIYQLSAEQKGKLENNIKAYLFRFRDEEGIKLDPNYITKKILKSIK